MSKITSKYQVSIPKALADRLGIGPGDEIDWRVAGTELRATPSGGTTAISTEERLRIFDAATKRQAARQRGARRSASSADRGWRREDLYDRGRTR